MSARQARPEGSPIPPSAIAEAGVWIVRLSDDGNNRTLKQGLRKWLDADPVNAKAFEAASDTWELSQTLRRVMPVPREQRPSRMFRSEPKRIRAWAAIAASVLVVAGAGAYVYLDHFSVLRTGVGEQRTLALEDGSRVVLNTDTRIVERYSSRERRIELKSGEAFFDVAPQATRPFIVNAGGRAITALGTSFVVRGDERELAVTLVDGKVAVSGGSADSRTAAAVGTFEERDIVLEPGERVTFVRATRLVRVDTPALESVTAWRRGQVVLDKTPLATAIEEMNRYSETKIASGDESGKPSGCPDLAINGLFQAGDSDKFANVISEAYGLTVTRQDGGIVLSGTPNPAPGVRKP